VQTGCTPASRAVWHPCSPGSFVCARIGWFGPLGLQYPPLTRLHRPGIFPPPAPSGLGLPFARLPVRSELSFVPGSIHPGCGGVNMPTCKGGAQVGGRTGKGGAQVPDPTHFAIHDGHCTNTVLNVLGGEPTHWSSCSVETGTRLSSVNPQVARCASPELRQRYRAR